MKKFVAGFICIVAAAVILAQGTTSRLVGVVQDPSGSSVAGATVRLKNEGTGTAFITTVGSGGTYSFESVQVGKYSVEVTAPGFKRFTSAGNIVDIGQPTTVNVTMQVGEVSESVEVTSSAEVVQTSTSGNIGNVIEEKQIKDLPIVGTRGRNPLQLIDLLPGVVDTQSITGGAVHVFGARDRAWNYTLDGIDSNESSSGGSNFSPLRTNPDSLAEFRVITSNPTAEYGRSSGAQVALITKSGTNQFHGGAFEFYRTPRFNANEWENNFNAIGKRQFVQHIYGGDVGGPIWKNHTFFFVNVQALRALETASTLRTVYTASARQGLLRFVPGGRNGNSGAASPSVDASGNVLPGVTIATYNIAQNDPRRLGIDKTVAGLVGATPLPNRFDVGDGLNTAGFNFSAAQQERQHDITFKVDQVINAKNAVYARISWGQQNTNCDRVNGGSELFPGTGCQVNTKRDPRNMAYNWRWNPTARLTNEAVFGQNRFTFDFDIPTADLKKQTLGGPVDLPFYDFGNARTLTTWQFVDNLAYQWNNHSLKFGTNLRWGRQVDSRGSVGSFNATQDVFFNADFDPVAFGLPSTLNQSFDLPGFQTNINFLLGRVGEVQRGFSAPNGNQFVEGRFPFDAHLNEYDIYVQDSWKVRKNLTVDLGLRWEMKPSPSAPNTTLLHPDQPLVAGGTPTNTAQWVPGSLFPDRMNNLGPSIGIAWDPFGTGRTSIRANYRIAYDRLNSFVLSSQIFNNLPGLTYSYDNTDIGQTDTRVSQLSITGPPANVKPSDFRKPAAFSQGNSIAVVDPNFKYPTTHQWAFSVQREIWKGGLFEADYIGRRAYHLSGAYNANQPNIFATGFVDAFNTVKSGGQSTLINRLFALDSRIRTNETASDMVRRVFASTLNLNSVASLESSLGTRVQGGRNVTALSGAGPFAVIPFPQFGGGVTVLESNDFSTYNGLVLQYQQRYRSGVQFQFSYTFSKALGTRDFDPTFSVVRTGASQAATSSPFDIYNRKLNYGPTAYDHTHVWQAHGTLEFPFGHGKKFLNNAPGVIDRVVGGWEVAPIFTYYDGRPFTVFSGANTFTNVVQSPAVCSGCNGQGQVFDQGGIKYFFNADQRAKFSAPAAGQLGSGRDIFRGPRFVDIDLSLLKRIRFTEHTNLELRADATNLTNTVSFGLPTATITSTVFGRIRDNTESSSRKVQLGAKFNF